MTIRPDIAVVTGAAGGLGRVLVDELLDAGVRVVAIDRAGDAARAWAGKLSDRAGFQFAPLDVSDEDAVTTFAKELLDAGEPVSYLVNNAAVQSRADLADLPSRRWDLVLRVNLLGTFLLTRALAPAMAARGFGRVVNLSSYYASRPDRGQAAYAASKGGVEAFTRSVALELAADGVTANVVSPGLIWHPNLEIVYTRAEFEALAADVPIGRTGRPEEITAAVRFLLSDEASYLTGQVLEINGGLHLR